MTLTPAQDQALRDAEFALKTVLERIDEATTVLAELAVRGVAARITRPAARAALRCRDLADQALDGVLELLPEDPTPGPKSS